MGAGNVRVTRLDCTLPKARSAAAARANLAACGGRGPRSPHSPALSGLVPRLLVHRHMRRELVALLLLVAAMSGQASAASTAERSIPAAPASSGGDACRRLPAGKRLKLNLKPNTELVDLVSWISAITCKQFILPASIPSQGKTVTIIAPQAITVGEAYRLFLDALDAVGFTVYRSGTFLRVIETSKIKSAPIPVYGDGED
jgi:type II secretion system GspD-like secretin